MPRPCEMDVARVATSPRPILPAEEELRAYLEAGYGDIRQHGWRAQIKWWFGYFAPETWYEVVVDRLVTDQTTWLDVGGGKAVFPHNELLSRTLADRCAHLVGVDPSANIELNPFVHERAQCFIEDFQSDRTFSLATLRMVAEHVQQPHRAVASLARLVEPGGKVVVYTPNKWSLASVTARLTPQCVHSWAASLLWRANDEDVFPTAYQMNTYGRLNALFADGGFREVGFARLDSCSLLQRFPGLYRCELSVWKAHRALGLPYFESNLLGVYEKQ